ncbi:MULTISPECIES: tyrosine-type recombinase/integrase [Candidatus Brocadia]|nr:MULTISPECIES: site-specific integrase [Brocadia]
MAVRFRKYFPQCKPIPCNGRQGKHCPGDRPLNKLNGQYRVCGHWAIEFFDDTKKWQSLTFKDIRSRADAERRLAMFIGDRERGKLNLPKKKVIPTLGEYSKTYLELYRGAKESTQDTKRANINILVKHLGDYRLDKITPFIIEKFRVDRREKDKVSDGSINDNITVFSHLFNTAIKAGVIDRNPCSEVKKLKIPKKHERVLSSEGIGLLLDKLQGKDRLMVLVGLFTGMRINEVLRLKWTDIDFTKGLIAFVQSKTGKALTIPISAYLIGELLRYKERCQEDWLFETREVTKRIANAHSHRFSLLFQSIGIRDFTFHGLRHTFSSLLQSELGVGAVVVQGMTGHSSLGMLQRYSHTGLDSKKRAVQALTDHVLGMGEKAVLPLAAQA